MEHLVLFAKAPRLHEVKTRLQPVFTPEQSLALHEAMLCDQVAFTGAFRGSGRSCEVCLDRAFEPSGAMARALFRLDRTIQGDGDLGTRMHRALCRAFDAGASAAAILGADAPTVPLALIEESFYRLRAGSDAVIIPAQDGGYVLVGAARPLPSLFESVPWGTPRVVEVTRRRARDAGYALAETALWHDVDVLHDLSQLTLDLTTAPDRAPETARFLTLLGLYAPQNPML